ncbi:MAG TPA: HXXEE domain-containing protein [Pyrinomonadaceae bacterium]|nr:HXXEE domain-containing protein [Pyrinomonadaceae bacterium]
MADEIRAGASLRILPWLYPAFYALHIAEEHWAGGGFPAYMARTRGVYITPARFLLLNGAAWALMVVGLLAARRMGFSRWLLVCLGTVLFINGLAHTLVATARAEYNPGLVSASLLFIPIGVYTLARIKREMRGRRVAGALVTGLLIHGVIFLLTLGRL